MGKIKGLLGSRRMCWTCGELSGATYLRTVILNGDLPEFFIFEADTVLQLDDEE